MSREVDSTWSPPKKDYLYDPMKLLEVLPGDSQVEPEAGTECRCEKRG